MNDLFADISYKSINHVDEQLCGDHVEQVCRPDGSQVIVLADGLGSGVKASILSTLTSKIIATMIAEGLPLEECVSAIAEALPVCSVRGVAYSTFTIIHLVDSHTAELIQYDNPKAILIRNGRVSDYPATELNLDGKRILKSRVRLQEGDVLIAMSDGCPHAGMGTTLREVIFDIGGGMRGPEGPAPDERFKAVQIGGPSGGCLTVKDLDIPLDFDSLKKVGAMIGSGGLVVMDDKTCMVEVARFFMNFTQNESCGKCVPCREGTKRMLEILERIVAGQGRDGDIELLEELADTISNTALCGLGKTAPSPVLSTIQNFRDEYEAHIYEKRCPAGACAKLRRFVIDAGKCKGCSKCARNCPVNAIKGVVKQPFVIDQEKCIKCGACKTNCNFGAVEEVY